MIVKLKEAYLKNRSIVLYLIFGVSTAALNVFSYGLLYEYINLPNVVSTIVAWLFAMIFAFLTNKLFVFESRRETVSAQLKEVKSFFLYRILTGVLDIGIMVVAVDLLGWNALIWKLISSIIVAIINFKASKLVIFNQQREDDASA